MQRSYRIASKSFILTALLIVAAKASADTQSSAPLATTKCEIIMIVKNQAGLDEKIEVPVKGPGHGGTPYSYHQGSFALDISVDGQWMVISWSKDGKTIASGEFVMAAAATSPRVAILANPSDADEQVSVSCDGVAAH